MKNQFLVLAGLLASSVSITAQSPQPLKKVMELKMPKTADDDMPGTRGASVAWHPVQKKYYAVFAGNRAYPLAVFDATGKRISSDTLSALNDVRGLWYDPASKSINGNGYNSIGWFSYLPDSKGIPKDFKIVADGMNQPAEQSVGAYVPSTKQVLFFHGSQIFLYDQKAVQADPTTIHWNRRMADGPGDDEDEEVTPEDYNTTTVIYTGIKGQELGFLNITNKEIELYDMKTGYLAKKLSLPSTATAEAMFNFAYANGIYWLFNMELRKWSGYK